MPKILMLDAGGTISQMRSLNPDINCRGVQPCSYLDDATRAVLEEVAQLEYVFAARWKSNSSDYCFSDWGDLAKQIYASHVEYDGVVIVHGTATLSYAASLCSFMLADIEKPIVFTGAQIPFQHSPSDMRSDGFANLLSAVKIAASQRIDGVVIVFGDHVLRGNRSHKVSVAAWNAFESPNFQPLARVDASGICYLSESRRHSKPALHPDNRFKADERVCLVPVHPGLQATSFSQLSECRAIVVPGYLAGIVPATVGDELRTLAKDHLVVVCGQAALGPRSKLKVARDGLPFISEDIVWSQDMTLEATITKTAWALSQESSRSAQRSLLYTDIAGEISAL